MPYNYVNHWQRRKKSLIVPIFKRKIKKYKYRDIQKDYRYKDKNVVENATTKHKADLEAKKEQARKKENLKIKKHKSKIY